MSLLWITAARLATFEEATEQSREHRRERADRWMDKQPSRPVQFWDSIDIPEHMGVPTPRHVINDIMHEHGDFPDRHWEHLPEEDVSLKQPIHFHQPTVDKGILKDKIGEDFRHDHEWDHYGDYDHDEGPQEPLFVKHEGKHYLLDGHHRFMKARLLGQSSMWGRVFDTANPEHRQEHCYDCQEHDEAHGEDGSW